MIETVQERQRGAHNFESYYENLCALQDTGPVPAVKAHLNDGVLDINGDRIRQQDWLPIFNSIKINKSLKFLAIRSYFQLNMEDDVPEKKAKVMRSRIPIIRMKDMTAALCKSLRDCLASTENLQCLELQGLHLRESHISLLGQGIMKNATLKHLSLECCRIGDSGLALLCSSMKMAGNISTLNLTSCNLSPVGIRDLSDLIKFQAMSRHNEAWKESLRYRWANFDTMIGLRRMTLNRNLSIGDEGAILLAESLKDDLWVKAIDLQECSLSSDAVRAFLKVLKLNATLVVLDLRKNPLIDRELLKSVTEQVLINGYGKEIEYQWLRAEDTMANMDENYDRHPRSYYTGPSKPLEAESRPAFKPAGRLRSRSVNSIDRHSSDRNYEDGIIKTPRSSSRGIGYRSSSKGQPWRTAVRAARYKGYPPDHVPGKNNLEEHYESPSTVLSGERKVERVSHNQSRTVYSRQKEKNSSAETTTRTNTDDEKSSSVVSKVVKGASQHPPLPESLKELKTEVFHLRTQLDKYSEEKRDMEQKLKEILSENSRLRNTIKLMSKTHSVIAQKSEKSAIMQDEAILETIENSFQQFNAFLDMLRQTGFSRIVTAAGMDNFTSSTHILEGIHRPRKLHSNESIGTYVPSVKDLDVASNATTDSQGRHKRPNGIANVNDSGDIRSPDRSESKVKGQRAMGNSPDDGVIGWKEADDKPLSHINGTGIGDDKPNRAASSEVVDILDCKTSGSGRSTPTNGSMMADLEDDDSLEMAGWKNDRQPLDSAGNRNASATVANDSPDHRDPLVDNIDRRSSPQSSSSTDEAAHRSNQIVDRPRYFPQASLDAAQELSTDTSL